MVLGIFSAINFNVKIPLQYQKRTLHRALKVSGRLSLTADHHPALAQMLDASTHVDSANGFCVDVDMMGTIFTCGSAQKNRLHCGSVCGFTLLRL